MTKRSSMTRTAKKLLADIRSRKARIGIIGLGYVGLPLAMAFVKKGFTVTGIDLDQDRVRALRRGQSYVEDVLASDVRRAVQQRRFEATDRFDALDTVSAIIICVPTPLNRVRDPDLSYVTQAVESVGRHLRRGQLVVLESTTYPGSTEEIVAPVLEKSGLRVDEDFFLCFSPERIDPGNKKFPLTEIPKVIGGLTPTSAALAAALYGCIVRKVIPVSSARTAEMAKLLENTFRIVNIGLVNELAQVADALGVNIWEAIDAASTKPFGYMPFYPGPGIGGHCIGVDPIYLSWKARLQGVDIHFIELARRINAQMPRFVVGRAVNTLNARAGKAVSHSKILILGVTYKRNVSDTRESPAFEIIQGLQSLGAKVAYHDPLVRQLVHDHLKLESEPLTPSTLRPRDLVMVLSDHSSVDYRFVARHARLIFDTRNVAWPAEFTSKIVKL